MRWVAVLVVVAFAGLGDSPAVAASRGPHIGAWHRIPSPGPEGVRTDGTRYAVTAIDRTRIRVADTMRRRHRNLNSPRCDGEGAVARAKPDYVLGSGLVVWQCQQVRRRMIWVDDIRTGVRTVPLGLAALWASETNSSDGATFTLAGVGRHWLYAIRRGYHYSDDILVGVHSPRVIRMPANRADHTVAPDTVEGIVTLCPGIRRTPGKLDIGRLPFSPLHYVAPYAVSTSGRLRACDGAPAARTGRLRVQLGGGLITWARSGRVYAQSTTTGRQTSRRGPGRVIATAHTSNTIYATTAPRRKGSTPRY